MIERGGEVVVGGGENGGEGGDGGEVVNAAGEDGGVVLSRDTAVEGVGWRGVLEEVGWVRGYGGCGWLSEGGEEQGEDSEGQ